MLLFLWGAVALAAILNGDKLPAAQTSSVAGNTLSLSLIHISIRGPTAASEVGLGMVVRITSAWGLRVSRSWRIASISLRNC